MSRAVPHLLAASLATFYAWEVSQTQFVTTGLQFVTPFLLVLLVHFGWLFFARASQAGFAQTVLARSAATSIGMVAFVFLAELFAPMPSQANDLEGMLYGILGVLFCVLILALIGAAIGLALYYTYRFLLYLYRSAKGKSDNDDNTLQDYGILAAVCGALMLASLEGLPWAYSFNGENRATATVTVDATDSDVWASMQTATSTSFPLPAILHAFPQPVAVLTDEGTGLGANRVVLIRGREGEGTLRLRVTESDAATTRFEVQSDSSPMASWIGFHALSYQVRPQGKATQLSVSLEYRRKLAPAWFFDPLMKGAAHLAMGVLARDTKARAEAMPKAPQGSI